MDQLDEVLKYLKKNKSRDPLGFTNEIFRPKVAGKDLKLALLKLLYRSKAELMLPEVLELCGIGKGHKMVLKTIEEYLESQLSEASWIV